MAVNVLMGITILIIFSKITELLQILYQAHIKKISAPYTKECLSRFDIR